MARPRMLSSKEGCVLREHGMVNRMTVSFGPTICFPPTQCIIACDRKEVVLTRNVFWCFLCARWPLLLVYGEPNWQCGSFGEWGALESRDWGILSLGVLRPLGLDFDKSMPLVVRKVGSRVDGDVRQNLWQHAVQVHPNQHAEELGVQSGWKILCRS
eukprot:6471981-Amphidinium_carterae.1